MSELIRARDYDFGRVFLASTYVQNVLQRCRLQKAEQLLSGQLHELAMGASPSCRKHGRRQARRLSGQCCVRPGPTRHWGPREPRGDPLCAALAAAVIVAQVFPTRELQGRGS